MKLLVYLCSFLAMIAFSSCHLTKLSGVNTPCKPYVQLKNGKKYTDTSISANIPKRDIIYDNGHLESDKIKIGDTSFRAKDVLFYCSGSHTFANLGKNHFAWEVAQGKINLYKSITTTTSYKEGHTSHQHHVHYYIQNGEGLQVKSLKYKNLSPMVTSGTPEYNMLEKYRKTRTISRIVGYSALALVVGGIVLANNDNDKVANTGVSLAALGVASYIGWLSVYVPNKGNLIKTVLVADKIDIHRHKKKLTNSVDLRPQL